MTKEEKKEARINWRFRWIELIFEFSHLEYQNEIWIKNSNPNIIGWYAEDVNQYFNDLSLEDGYNLVLKENYVSKEELAVIEEFHLSFDDFVEVENHEQRDMSDKQRLIDTGWIQIVKLGFEAWNRLKLVIIDQEELKLIAYLESYYLKNKNIG